MSDGKSKQRVETIVSGASATQRQIASDRQMAMRMQTAEITGFLHDSGVQSLVKGSTAMLMHGADVQPGDVDLYVDKMGPATKALSSVGYNASGMFEKNLTDPRRLLPDIDLLSGPDRGVPKAKFPQKTQMIGGVPVRKREDLIRDIMDDDRDDKALRNEAVLKHLQS